MIKLNLKAETAEHEILKAYLQENVSTTLAEKIENGVKIVKDGKTLINKKDLAGFMKYACEEARKLAAKGATGACVKDEIVFGWLIHYFEEDSIEGTLLNEDGTPYQAPKKQPSKPIQRIPAPILLAKPTPSKPAQCTLFDMLAQSKPKEQPVVDESEETEPESTAEGGNEPPFDDYDEEEDELTEREMREFDGDIDDGTHWIDENTYVDNDGEVHEMKDDAFQKELDLAKAFEKSALCILDELLGDILALR